MTLVAEVSQPGRVVAFGELLLRLCAPDAERLLQGPVIQASFGGAEFNVLASLARFGLAAEFVTALPEDSLGWAASAAIRQHGVGVRHVAFERGRMGLYFMEAGNGIRPAKVLYDRADSVFARAGAGLFDWRAILAGARCLHLTGITPAVSETAATLAATAVATAASLGITVSLDINLRPQIWQLNGREPYASLEPLLKHAHVVFATPNDWRACLPGHTRPATGETAGFADFAAALFEAYPTMSLLVASNRRRSDVADFTLGATAQRRAGERLNAQPVDVRNAVERIGSGDALVAACLYGLFADWPDQRWLDFGVAAQALKHTIRGDLNRVSVAEIELVQSGAGHGGVIR